MPATKNRIGWREKEKRHVGRYTAQTPDGPQRKSLYSRKGETKKDLEKRLALAMGDAARGFHIDSKNLKVDEWLELWLSNCIKPLVEADKIAYSTYARYRGIVNKHLSPALGHRKLKDLTRPEVRRLYADKSKTLSPRTVDYIHVTLQMALSQAVWDDLIYRNVAQRARPRSSRHASLDKAKALSATQVRALLAAARGIRNEALYAVALHTGLRQGELLGLWWKDLDLEAESPKLSVRHALKVTDHGLDFGPPKNNLSRRSIPLNRTAVAALRAHRTRQKEERLAAPEWRDARLVFPNRVGGPMDHTNLYGRDYKPLLERAGLADEGFTFHALRHTFATELFNQGKRPKIIQTLLGHSSIVQTMDTYSHLLDDMDGDEVGGLDEAFG